MSAMKAALVFMVYFPTERRQSRHERGGQRPKRKRSGAIERRVLSDAAKRQAPGGHREAPTDQADPQLEEELGIRRLHREKPVEPEKAPDAEHHDGKSGQAQEPGAPLAQRPEHGA